MKRGKMTIDYNLETNRVSVHIELVDGTVWLTKSEICELFGVYNSAVSAGLRIIYQEDEAFYMANRKEIRYKTTSSIVEHTSYNLDIILLLAFRMRGGNCHLFRQWFKEQVKRPIVESSKQTIIIHLNPNMPIV